MAKTEMIYENLLPHSISEISLLHRKIGVHTSLTFSTKKWTIRKIWCPCLEKPNRTIDAWFFGGEGNDLSNDHHNSIENVIKNFSFFCAFMDSLLGHHMPNVYITYCRPLSRQFMQIDYDNRARNADFASNMSFAFFSMDHSEQNVFKESHFQFYYRFCLSVLYWCQRPVSCSASAFPARFAVDSYLAFSMTIFNCRFLATDLVNQFVSTCS